MMLSAIISDTVLFRSPTTTEEDKKAVKELAEIAGVDYEAYGMDMLKAGADISDYTADQLAHNDTKEFEAGDKVFTCGQISVMDTAPSMRKSGDHGCAQRGKSSQGLCRLLPHGDQYPDGKYGSLVHGRR